MDAECFRRAPPPSLLSAASDALAALGVDTPELDAELLLAEAMGISRTQLLTFNDQLTDDALRRYADFIARRAAREPLAYITGRKEFFSLEFQLSHEVLIPRAETELAVSAALEKISRHSYRRVLDIGTGSGAIAIAIAVNAPDVAVTAIDVSEPALEIAKRNADKLGCASCIQFRLADVQDENDEFLTLNAPFDVVVSNPPYIKDSEL